MFSEVMPVLQPCGGRGHAGGEAAGGEGHVRRGLQHQRVLDGLYRAAAPGEGPVLADEDAGHGLGVDAALAEGLDYDLAGVEMCIRDR